MHCFLSSLFSSATARATVAAASPAAATTSDGPRRSVRLAKDEALDRVFAASDTVDEAKVAVAATRADLALKPRRSKPWSPRRV